MTSGTGSPDEAIDPTEEDPTEEGPIVKSLLAATGLEYTERDPDDVPSVADSVHRWHLATDIADVAAYWCEDVEAAAAELLESVGPADIDGFPAVGTNGRLVYVVRYTGDPDDRQAVYRALDVASALGGDEY